MSSTTSTIPVASRGSLHKATKDRQQLLRDPVMQMKRWRGKQEKSDQMDVSVVIPVFNERENLPALVERLISALDGTRYDYELIFVDDRSSDRSAEFLRSLESLEQVRVLEKQGKRGKAFSLQEGFGVARGSVIVMIDADLQYPPEAIPDMLEELQRSDVVVANRTHRKTSFARSLFSRTYRYVFARVLLSLRVDVQSGLKAFRTEVLKNVVFTPSAWGFDYEFLFRAQRIGYQLGQVNIVFGERSYGKSQVSPVFTALELLFGTIALRLKTLPLDLLPFLSYPHASEYRAQGYANTEDYLFLPDIESVRRHLYAETITLAAVTITAGAALMVGLSMATGLSPLLILSGSMAMLYLFLILFKTRVVFASLTRKPLGFRKRDIATLQDDDLPVYTIIIPLYKEAEVIEQIIEAMSRIDYPTDKLDIIITLEKYDRETIDAIKAARPPAHFRSLMLPDVKPKTKPKALNVAFLEARGEFVVIYDAEIIPDPDQLKKAVLAFRAHPELACLQTCLDHYNADQNWITKLFNAEFSFQYDLFLPGLQRGDHALPLSGHSTHFRRDVLEDIGAWDPYNLTEDCDIGIRLARRGYKTDIIDSRSQEEATCSMRAWIAQRSRWMQGFIQTSIVHLRHPLRLKNDLGSWRKFCTFLIIVPGSVVMNMINLFYWGLLGAWFVTHSAAIQTLFPGPVLYVSLISLAIGNFTFMYLNLIALYRRERFGLVKYALLSFFYWLMLGYAAVRACVKLFVKPYQWEKTSHGKHLLTPKYAPVPLSS